MKTRRTGEPRLAGTQFGPQSIKILLALAAIREPYEAPISPELATLSEPTMEPLGVGGRKNSPTPTFVPLEEEASHSESLAEPLFLR